MCSVCSNYSYFDRSMAKCTCCNFSLLTRSIPSGPCSYCLFLKTVHCLIKYDCLDLLQAHIRVPYFKPNPLYSLNDPKSNETAAGPHIPPQKPGLNLKSWIWFSHLFVLTFLQMPWEARENKQVKNKCFSRIISYWGFFFFFFLRGNRWEEKFWQWKNMFSFSVKMGVKIKTIFSPTENGIPEEIKSFSFLLGLSFIFHFISFCFNFKFIIRFYLSCINKRIIMTWAHA